MFTHKRIIKAYAGFSKKELQLARYRWEVLKWCGLVVMLTTFWTVAGLGVGLVMFFGAQIKMNQLLVAIRARKKSKKKK